MILLISRNAFYEFLLGGKPMTIGHPSLDGGTVSAVSGTVASLTAAESALF